MVHIQNGSFAIAAIVANKKVISFHDVASYGHPPYYTIDVTDFGNMDMDAESISKKVDYESNFYNGQDTISMTLYGTILSLTNGNNVTHSEDLSDMI